MSKRAIIKKYLYKANNPMLTKVDVKYEDLKMICELALAALDGQDTGEFTRKPGTFYQVED